MSRHQYDKAVHRVATEVLESLALMYLITEDEAPKPAPECSRRVAVSFDGLFDGLLILSASEGVLLELAANMLGLESGQSATPQQQEDAMKELANVICGNLLPAIAGKEPVFHINAPDVLEGQPLPQTDRHHLPTGETRLLADTGVLEVRFFVGQPSAAVA